MAPKQIAMLIMIQARMLSLFLAWYPTLYCCLQSRKEGMVEKPTSLSRVRTHGPRGLYSRLETFLPLNLESGRKIARLGLGRAHTIHWTPPKNHLDYIFFGNLMQKKYIHWIHGRFNHFWPVQSKGIVNVQPIFHFGQQGRQMLWRRENVRWGRKWKGWRGG